MGCGTAFGAGVFRARPVLHCRRCIGLALLARELNADCLIIATDVDAVYLDWGLPEQRALRQVSPNELARHSFPAGSMGPKVEAASRFAATTGKRALIGSLQHIEAMLEGRAGTDVRHDAVASPAGAATGAAPDLGVVQR